MGTALSGGPASDRASSGSALDGKPEDSRDTTPIVYVSPFPSSSPGYYPVLRNNRGSQGFIFGPTSGAPTVTNHGPFDCMYYVAWGGATIVALSLKYPGGTSVNLPISPPVTAIFVPVGASLTAGTAGGTPSYTGFCLP